MIMIPSSPLESLYQEELYRIGGKVVIIISKPWEEVSNAEKILLEKILGAVKLTPSAVQIIACKEFDLKDFKAYSPSCIIAFGATLKNSTKMYEPISIENTFLIVADELNALDELKKRNLWLTLKKVFQS